VRATVPPRIVFRVTIAPRQSPQFVPTRRPLRARTRRHADSCTVVLAVATVTVAGAAASTASVSAAATAAIVTATDGQTERAKSAPGSLHAQLLYLQQYIATTIQTQ